LPQVFYETIFRVCRPEGSSRDRLTGACLAVALVWPRGRSCDRAVRCFSGPSTSAASIARRMTIWLPVLGRTSQIRGRLLKLTQELAALRPAARNDSGQSMRVAYGMAMLVVLGPLCFGAAWLAQGLGEGPVYCTWFGSLIVAGFVSGRLWPPSVVWGALLITWSQSAFVYWQLEVAGEIAHPSHSTGGRAGWEIVTIILIVFSPFPALASLFGCRMRRPAQLRAASDARPQAGDRG
jgi:hypothetical protein